MQRLGIFCVALGLRVGKTEYVKLPVVEDLSVFLGIKNDDVQVGITYLLPCKLLDD